MKHVQPTTRRAQLLPLKAECDDFPDGLCSHPKCIGGIQFVVISGGITGGIRAIYPVSPLTLCGKE